MASQRGPSKDRFNSRRSVMFSRIYSIGSVWHNQQEHRQPLVTCRAGQLCTAELSMLAAAKEVAGAKEGEVVAI